MTLTPRALCQLSQFVPIAESQMYRNKRVKFLCDRVELQTPLADDWDWSRFDRCKPEPEPEPECRCEYIDVDLVDNRGCEVHR